MLRVENLTYQYPQSGDFALNVSEWSCSENERVAIVGRSGSGKTTFLKCLAGLLQPSSGAIYWKDEKVKGASERLVPGNDKIKLVQQDFGQDPHIKVVENLRKYILSHDDDERADRISHWLRELNIESLGTRKTIHLSGGQLQRVALAQTLLAEPEVLLLDEPFSNIDPIHKQEFIPALRSLFNREDTTMITVMHDPVDALRLVDRMVVFGEGEIVEDGTPDELYHRPKTLESVRLFGTVNVLEPVEYSGIFGFEPDRPSVEGMCWFRPHEMRLSQVKAPFEIVHKLPMQGDTWVEIMVNGVLLVLSE